jgi:hypothetical protein
LDDIREDTEEDGERSEGVAVASSLPTPEELVSRMEGEELKDLPLFQAVMERLRPEQGRKWLILFLLREHESTGYEYSEIVKLLTNPPVYMASGWADLYYQLALPSVIPRDWSEVCSLFQTLPPKLTEIALRQFYSRGLAPAMKSKLKVLVGLSVTGVLKIHDYVQLFFEKDITLNIYNDYRLTKGAEIASLKEARVEKIEEKQDELILYFSEAKRLRIDLRDEAYNGPEALQLNVPGEPTVVWN